CPGIQTCTGAGLCQQVLPFCSSASTSASVDGHALTDCLYTSIDARPGFSGGPLLAYYRYQLLAGTILFTVTSRTIFTSGVMSFVADYRDPGSDLGTWALDSNENLALCTGVTEPSPTLTDCYLAVSEVNPSIVDSFGNW